MNLPRYLLAVLIAASSNMVLADESDITDDTILVINGCRIEPTS